MNCRVCKTELEKEYSACPYCGFVNAALMNPNADTNTAYRDDLLKKITDISVMAPRYRYDEEKKAFSLAGREKIYQSHGVRCFDKRYISTDDKWIAHFEGTAEIDIAYTFDGTVRSVRAKLSVTPTEGLWYLALQIDKELRLNVYLYAEIDPKPDSQNTSVKWKVLDQKILDLTLRK